MIVSDCGAIAGIGPAQHNFTGPASFTAAGLRGGTETVEAMRRRVEADIDYIQTWSILKDAKIVLLTIPSLLLTENAY